ncbi:hypothetical protein M434DRAFT_399084, partial [Hypoxylon sp. CO27-5]
MDGNNNHSHATSERRKRPHSRNEDIPPAACDQCRSRKVKCDRLQPECSNCRKAGVPCVSSGASKRVNQTKQLRDDFSSVLERLDDVDQTLSTLTQLTQQIAARTYAHEPSSKPDHCTPSIIQPAERSSSSSQNVILPSSQKARRAPAAEEGCLHTTVKLEHGGERIYPYPAALALMKAFSRELAKVLAGCVNEEDSNTEIVTKDPALRAALRQQLEGYPYTHCKQPVVTSDHGPITTPPRFLVDLFVDGFLRNVNCGTPIFDEISLRQAIEAHYSGELSDENSAWALIFNNIVVLMLGLEAQAARASHSNSRNMNDDLIPSFLRNCDRALANLGPLILPSLVNVQALLTLALVARQLYGNIMFERVCHAACQVGRTLGLPRSKCSENSTDGNSAERERLFRVLYALDKQRVFASGQPCDLYSFDSDLVLTPAFEYDSPIRKLNNAFDHMMEIWEEIYLALYSSRAVASGKAHRVRHARRLAQLIDEWYEQHQKLMEATFMDDTAELGNLQLELKYCYHVTQVLILCHDRQNGCTQRQLRDHDRTCLRLMNEVGSLPTNGSRIALLGRMLGNYPVAAFVDLVAFHFNTLTRNGISDAELESDFELLCAVCRYLQMLRHPNFPSVYFTHLYKGMSWALSILELLKTRSGDQVRRQPGFMNARSDNQQCQVSFIPTITPCPVVDLVSEAELMSFGFYTAPQPSTSLDMHSSADAYPIPNHLDYNMGTDPFQGLFTPEKSSS